MFQSTIEVNSKKIALQVEREAWELTDSELHSIFCEIREHLKNGLVIEDSENPGHYDLNLEAIDLLRDFAVDMFDFDNDISERFWQSFTVMIIEEED